MGSYLTKEQIERASRREGVQRPAISVLEYHEPRIVELGKEYSLITDSSEAQAYLSRNFGFLGDALEEAGDFSLGPLDLVAIWSKTMELWPNNYDFRRCFGNSVCTSYGIQDRPDLKGLSRYYLENHGLPDTLMRSRTGLLHIKDRLDHIKKSVCEIRLYVHGTDSPMELGAELTEKANKGDEKAKKQIEHFLAYYEEHLIPPLAELIENIGKSTHIFSLTIEEALDELAENA